MTEGEVQRAMMQDEDYVEFLPTELLVPHYLIHCFLYYKMNKPIVDDHVFDELARRLDDEWEEAEHFNRDLIDREGLSSGGHYINYPRRVECSAQSLWQ